MSSIKKIGVLTGGGDAPGLNAVIRAVVKAAYNSGVEVLGLEDSFDGLRNRGVVEGLGGRQGDRTPDLCIANAALSQLS